LDIGKNMEGNGWTWFCLLSWNLPGGKPCKRHSG